MPKDSPSSSSRRLIQPKQGNAWEECEDAAVADDRAGRFAVADGASESICAGEWAKMLSEAFVAGPPEEETFHEWLSPIQQRWRLELADRPVPWYIEEKFRDGSFATLLGLVIEPKANGSSAAFWRALSVGDCCLFRVRGDSNVRAFPVQSASSFGTRPSLLGSRPNRSSRPQWSTGSLREGDRLLLATDALAEWFLKQIEAGNKPWRELAGLTAEEFAPWLEEQRKTRKIKNDDVTLLAIDWHGDER